MLKYTVERNGTAELQAMADELAADYFAVMLQGINNEERSLQKIIGPSEIGEECERSLVHKLCKDEEPNKKATLRRGWKPAVGKACHSQQEEWFTRYRPAEAVTEQRVAVGIIGGEIIEGSSDLYYFRGAVIDHKFLGKTRLLEVKGKGFPGAKYQKQAHLYGRGFKLRGHDVKIVMVCFLPRDGELKDSYVWWEPFDEGIALAALARANSLFGRIQAEGKAAVLDSLPLCQSIEPGDPGYNKDADWCPWCTPLRNAERLAASDPFDFSTANRK
jgi:hypothetical protein